MRYRVTNREEPIDWSAAGDDRVLQSIANILRAWRGEVPFLRDLGLDPAIQHAPATQAEALTIAEVHRNIADFVPRAQVLQVRVETGDGLYIEVDVEVRPE